MSTNQHPDNDQVKIMFFSDEFTEWEDDPEFPLLPLESKFSTIQDWLTDMCKHENPEKPIAGYNFGLFESPDDYVLSLTGKNTYTEENSARICIEFRPEHMYFQLPKAYHENLNRDQLLEKLVDDLTSFSKTNTFQNSFFTLADGVYFDTSGFAIWSK